MEQYSNKDVITQICILKDHAGETDEELEKTKALAESAQDAAEKAYAKALQVDAFDERIAQAQEDATLALTQAEEAQTDADRGIVTAEIRVTESEGHLWMKSAANVETQTNIPIASSVQSGIMNAQTYKSLEAAQAKIAELEAKTRIVYVKFASDSPTQDQITELFTAAAGRAPVAGDVVSDIARSLTYGYDGTAWIATQIPISTWTNSSAGIIKGVPKAGAAGTLFAEADGTGSVNGWDDLNTKITNGFKTSAKAFSGYTITEMADRVQVKFDALDGTSVSEEIPSANDEKAGMLSAADHTLFSNKSRIQGVEVTLAAANWTNGSQEVDCSVAQADNVLWVSPSPSSFLAYGQAGIYASAQAEGKMTFTCQAVPVNDIVVNIVGVTE